MKGVFDEIRARGTAFLSWVSVAHFWSFVALVAACALRLSWHVFEDQIAIPVESADDALLAAITIHFFAVALLLVENVLRSAPVEGLADANLLERMWKEIRSYDGKSHGALEIARGLVTFWAFEIEERKRRVAEDEANQKTQAAKKSAADGPHSEPSSTASDDAQPNPFKVIMAEKYRPEWEKEYPDADMESLNIDLFPAVDRNRVINAINAASGNLSAKIAPSNFLETALASLVLMLGAIVILMMRPDEMPKVHGELATSNASVAVWIVLDQVLKGLVVDVIEFFDIPLMTYDIRYDHVLMTVVLFTLRVLPAAVTFRVIGLYLQQGTIQRLVLGLTTEPERRVLDTLRRRPRDVIDVGFARKRDCNRNAKG